MDAHRKRSMSQNVHFLACISRRTMIEYKLSDYKLNMQPVRPRTWVDADEPNKGHFWLSANILLFICRWIHLEENVQLAK